MEKNRNTGFLISTIAFCLVAVTSLPLRTYQFFTNIEAGTGFWLNASDMFIFILYGILAAGIIISMAASLVYKKELGFDRTPAKRPVQGIIALLAAVSILYETALNLNIIINELPSAAADASRVSLYVLCGQVLFGVFAAIYFVVFGISMLSGSTNASEYKVISVAPPVWFMLRLVYRFTTKISFIKVSDLLLELFMLAFMLMFYTAFAQLNSKIESKGLDWKLVGYGLPAAALALICFVPRFIMMISGNGNMLYSGSPIEYCDLGVALLAMSIIFTRIGWVGGNADSKED